MTRSQPPVHRRPGSCRMAAVVVLLLLAAAPRAAAQRLVLELTDAADRPVAGALVALLGAEGAVAQAATGPEGAAVLAAPGPGRYRVVVRRIGFQPDSATIVQLAAGETRPLRLRLTTPGVRLAEVRVETTSRCRRRDDAEATAAVWEQVRTALALTELGRETLDEPVQAQLFVRHLDAQGRVLVDSTRPPTLTAVRPFSAGDPRERSTHGWVEARDRSQVWHAPDERSLLSDQFARDHCYALEHGTGARAGQIGLRFAPAPDRRYPEVTGTLWVDVATAELRELEYAYVNVPLPRPAPLAGGRVRFRRLDDGAWIVDEWAVRMPRWYEPERGEQPRLAFYVEQGGVAEPYEGGPLLGMVYTPPGAVAGQIVDDAGGPLPGARLWLEAMPHDPLSDAELEGEAASSRADPALLPLAERPPLDDADAVLLDLPLPSHRAVSDPEGRFAIFAVPPGRYRLVATHARLDSAGFAGLTRELQVHGELVTQQRLALPAWDDVSRGCAARTLGERRGVLVGRILDDSSGLPLRDAAVLARWSDIATDPERGIRASASELVARTDERGVYRLCGVETENVVTVQGFAGRAATAPVMLLLGERAYARRDLVIGPDPVITDDAGSGLVDVRAGTVAGPGAVLTGVVRDGAGRPRPNARVSVGDREASADDSGRFTIEALMPGTAMVEARAVGLQPSVRSVSLRGGDTVHVALRLGDPVVTLERVDVRGQRNPPPRWVTEAEARAVRPGNRGHHLGYHDLRRLATLRTGLLNLTGVLVQSVPPAPLPLRFSMPDGASTERPPWVVLLPYYGSGSQYCVARVYVDGRETDWAEVASYQPQHLYHVEVYPRPGNVPAEFLPGADYRCGVVLLWTDLGYTPPARSPADSPARQ